MRTAPKTTGKGVLYRFSSDGSPEQLLEDSDEHFTSLALGQNGQPFVGTGVNGRIYTVDDSHNDVLMADTEERQHRCDPLARHCLSPQGHCDR